jgi:hypothetical protein
MQHFSLEYYDIFKCIENAFQTKGAYAPESQNHLWIWGIRFLKLSKTTFKF